MYVSLSSSVSTLRRRLSLPMLTVRRVVAPPSDLDPSIGLHTHGAENTKAHLRTSGSSDVMQLLVQILGMMYRALDLQLCTGYSLQHATLFTLEDCDGLVPGINIHRERLSYLHIEPRHCNLGLCNFPGRDERVCKSSEAKHRSRFDFNMIPWCLQIIWVYGIAFSSA